MKKYSLLVSCLLLLLACQQNVSEQKSMNKVDSLKIAIYDRLFKSNSDKAFISPTIIQQPIKNKLAQDCISLYEHNYRSITKITKSVSFDSDSLRLWLYSLDTTKYTELRMFLGIYTKEIIKEYTKSDTLIGRVSIFIWPYQGDKPAPPGLRPKVVGESTDVFNLGDIHN